jgi:hypothetical protein
MGKKAHTKTDSATYAGQNVHILIAVYVPSQIVESVFIKSIHKYVAIVNLIIIRPFSILYRLYPSSRNEVTASITFAPLAATFSQRMDIRSPAFYCLTRLRYIIYDRRSSFIGAHMRESGEKPLLPPQL